MVVELLDHAERDARWAWFRFGPKASVNTREPSSESASETGTQGADPGKNVRHNGRGAVVGRLELEVVDLARHHGVGVEDLSVEEMERGIEASSACGRVHHAPAFVAIIKGMVASDTTTRITM